MSYISTPPQTTTNFQISKMTNNAIMIKTCLLTTLLYFLITQIAVNGDTNDGGSSHHVNTLAILEGIVLIIVVCLLIFYYIKSRKLEKIVKRKKKLKQPIQMETSTVSVSVSAPDNERRSDDHNHGHGHDQQKQIRGRGSLIFIDNSKRRFELNDLLKASAEGLGKGNFANSYKATLESGWVVVVKRLRDLKPLSEEEFVRNLKKIAEQNHPNLLQLLAYYYSKEEKLLLYNLASKGNVFNRLHSGRETKSRIPFTWSSRLAVARAVGRALEYLHRNAINSPQSSSSSFFTAAVAAVPHGNLKSSNILLDKNDDVLVADYGLLSIIANPIAAQRMIVFKSPEYQSQRRLSRKSDVWSFGCFLLELLTGRISVHGAPPGVVGGVDLGSWVHRAVREEWTAEIFDLEICVRRGANPGMLRLLEIAVRCCDRMPERRPEIGEAVKEIESIKAVAEDSEEEIGSSFDRSVTDDSMSITAAAPTYGV